MSPKTSHSPSVARRATYEQLRRRIADILDAGFSGDFDHIELVEVIGCPRGGAPLNVLSIAVLAEGRPQLLDVASPQLLTGRIPIEGFVDWSFGAARSVLPVAALDRALEQYADTGTWALSGKPLQTGVLAPEPEMFAPPDGTATVPLNKILKNNFWAGSYVFRLTDTEKLPFQPFFADRRRLQALSDEISRAVPMAFSGLADFLGDVLIQVPITTFVPSVAVPRNADHSVVAAIWRPGVRRRPLTVAGRTRWDELLTGAAIRTSFETSVELPIDSHRQPLETELWDAQTGALVAATAATTTIKSVLVDIHVIQHEPRVFTAADADGKPRAERIALISTTTAAAGEPAGRDAQFWLGQRQDLEEKRALEQTRDFVQYRPKPGASDERERALADVRFLITKHGVSGADLWDPYLSGEDLLQTLFWCSQSGAPLRALTDGRDPPAPCAEEAEVSTDQAQRPSFSERQRAVLQRDCGNREGLRLEYRTRRGPKGWSFHDRFLIFPAARGGPLAWSLGTSVNSLGKAHHILQKVSNPALVAGAFNDLWTALDESEHVIWRSW